MKVISWVSLGFGPISPGQSRTLEVELVADGDNYMDALFVVVLGTNEVAGLKSGEDVPALVIARLLEENERLRAEAASIPHFVRIIAEQAKRLTR